MSSRGPRPPPIALSAVTPRLGAVGGGRGPAFSPLPMTGGRAAALMDSWGAQSHSSSALGRAGRARGSGRSESALARPEAHAQRGLRPQALPCPAFLSPPRAWEATGTGKLWGTLGNPNWSRELAVRERSCLPTQFRSKCLRMPRSPLPELRMQPTSKCTHAFAQVQLAGRCPPKSAQSHLCKSQSCQL